IAERWPDIKVILVTGEPTVETAASAVRSGAYDYISKPFKQDEVLLTLRKAEERLRLRRENARLRAALAEFEGGVEVLGRMLIHSAAMRQLAKTMRKVARFETTVLILGESGVGKELVCRALHELGPRKEGPFVALNCGAIPEGLLESELFGHAKGAFTGATRDRPGLFEEAEGGSLFLDEIGDMPASLQAKLTRVLEDRHIRRLGEVRERAVDVRLIAATHRDIERMVADGTFREDLWYRLNVFTLSLPPLRERPEDVPALVAHFVEHFRGAFGRDLAGPSP
ncbi:MAG: sigma-54-dependent Fis family transcriptional regulator, partial [Myxococcales bacterium]|nr:sigma-54-dependent Fis family transcriptional regulator [Myxococcales bacterium]